MAASGVQADCVFMHRSSIFAVAAVGLARVGFNAAVSQSLSHFEQLFLRVACQSAEFRQIGYRRLGGKRRLILALPSLDRDRNKPSVTLQTVLHRLEQRHIVAQ